MTTLALSQCGKSWALRDFLGPGRLWVSTESPKPLHHTTDNDSPNLGIISHHVCAYLLKAVCGAPAFQNASLNQHLIEDQSSTFPWIPRKIPPPSECVLRTCCWQDSVNTDHKIKGRIQGHTFVYYFLTSNWKYFPYKIYTLEKLFRPEAV